MTGVVLAGGRSTRMGRDKALIEVGGRRLIDRAVATLRQECDDVVVAGARRTGVQAEFIADAAGEGPLAGIVAGLLHASTPLIAVVAVDMPYASAAVLRRLAGAWTGEPAVAARADGSIQPLHAVYATQAAAQFEALLAAGERSPRAAIELLGGAVLDPAGYDSQGTAGRFWVNLNRPEDLQALADTPATS